MLPDVSGHRRAWRGALAAALLAAAGAGPAAAQGAPQPAPVPVRTAEVRKADVPVALEGIGTVRAYNEVTVRAQVDGVLQEVAFAEGEAVKAGQVLARIDPRPYQAALDQARAKKAEDEAQLQNARLNLQRYEGVGDFASRQQVATQQAAVARLEAQIRADQGAIDYAATQLAYATIASPMDGITGIRLVDQGNLLRAADATGVVVVTQVRPISLLFALPAEALGEIRAAMRAGPLAVTAAERQGARALGEGTLALVDNRIDPATGQLRLKATLPNEDGALWPGQFVDARLLLRTERGVPVVPSTAVQRGPDGTWLYAVGADRSVSVRKVAVRRYEGGLAVLEGGPDPGTRVVVSGQFRLTPGARVEEVPEPAAEAPRAVRAAGRP
jgi:multidrug efflux system membrane fusion protein